MQQAPWGALRHIKLYMASPGQEVRRIRTALLEEEEEEAWLLEEDAWGTPHSKATFCLPRHSPAAAVGLEAIEDQGMHTAPLQAVPWAAPHMAQLQAAVLWAVPPMAQQLQAAVVPHTAAALPGSIPANQAILPQSMAALALLAHICSPLTGCLAEEDQATLPQFMALALQRHSTCSRLIRVVLAAGHSPYFQDLLDQEALPTDTAAAAHQAMDPAQATVMVQLVGMALVQAQRLEVQA